MQEKKFRILAVDDNEDVLELIRSTIEQEYAVMTLSSPVDLYELMDLYEPDLIVLDIMMPRITGYQIIEILRRNPSTSDLPIIVLSAKASSSEVKHGYRLGATMYLPKPFNPERLLKNLETQFRMHPPASRNKQLSLEEVHDQLKDKTAYRKGFVQLSGEPPKQDVKFIDLRKKMQEKINAKRQAARGNA